MKLKERLRIAWQVLTKGTCDELKRAVEEKRRYENGLRLYKIEEKELRKLYLDFREFLLLFDRPNNMLCEGDDLREITIADFRFEDYRDLYPYVPRRFDKEDFDGRYRYTLYNAYEEIGSVQDVKNIMSTVELMKLDAAAKLSNMLIRDGILKMDIVSDSRDCNRNVIRFSIPYLKKRAIHTIER